MAVRTVSVELKMKISDFELAAAKAAATTKALAGEFDDLGKTSGKFSTAKPTREMQNFSRVINGALKDGKTGFASIQTAIDDTKTHIAKLRQEIHTGSGSDSIFGDLRQANKDLRTLQGVMKDIGVSSRAVDANLKSAGREVSDFRGQLIKMAVAAAPFLLPAAAGSVLGVLGAGGLALGIVGQLKRPDVQVALAGFGEDVQTTLTKATAPFGPELAKSIGILDAGVTGFLGDLRPALKALAPELSVFTKTVSGGLLEAGPLFANAMARSRPDVQALGGLVADLSVGTGQFFNNLSIGAEGGAAAIHDLGTEVKDLQGDLGTILGAIAQTYGAIHQANDAINNAGHGTSFWSKSLGIVTDSAHDALDPVTQVSNAVQGLSVIFGGAGKTADSFDGSVEALTGNVSGSGLTAAQALASAYDDLASAMSSAEGQALTLDRANLNLKQAQADLGSTLKHNKNNWDQNTQAGRDDWSQLLDNLEAIKRVHDAQVAQGGATDKNTAAYYRNVDGLLAIAKKAGLSKDEIKKLRDQFEKLPPKVDIPVNVKVHVSESPQAAQLLARSQGHPIASRWGGVYQPAADGLLTTAQVYTPVNPGRFMIAEPATRGEAFIPKNGDYGRSMSILSAAAGWYGAHVVEGRGSGGGGGPVTLVVTGGDAAGAAFVQTMRFAIQQRGGDVVKVLTPR